MAKTKKHFEGTKRVRAQIIKAMKAIIADETSKTTLSDVELNKAILARGVWTTLTITREVRNEAGIPQAMERRAQHFTAEYRAGK